MSMKEELMDVVKALILPELADLKQGMTDLKAEWTVTNGRLSLLEERYDDLRDQMNQRFDEVDKRFDQMNQRFEQVDKRFEQVDRRFDEMKANADRRFLSLENGQEGIRRDIAEVRSYVWTSGLDARGKQLFVKEQQKGYDA